MEHDIRFRPCALIFRGESILLVEYNDENGPYYNLPGGGLEYHETIKEAVKRELLEEASVEIEVGPIAYEPEYQGTDQAVLCGTTEHYAHRGLDTASRIGSCE